MLLKLTIRNVVLIESWDVSLEPGFTVITGETGAGKSVLLNALGMVLGDRADTSVFRDPSQKVIVEAAFTRLTDAVIAFLERNDLDVEPQCLLRREITPSGKSRAFINDTPVLLNQLRELGSLLVDIHGQHENLLIQRPEFQLEVVDALAGTGTLLTDYRQVYADWKRTSKQLREWREQEARMRKDEDYFRFQWEEIQALEVDPGEQEPLEAEVKRLEHAEEIQNVLEETRQHLEGEEQSLLEGIRQVSRNIQQLEAYDQRFGPLAERLQSQFIELKDIGDELSMLSDTIHHDPGRLDQAQERLDQLNRLLVKHQLQDLPALLQLQDELKEKLDAVGNLENEIATSERLLQEQEQELDRLAGLLHEARTQVFPELQKKVLEGMRELGLEKAVFEVKITASETWQATGKDAISFLFSANPGMPVHALGKVASGGEKSRLLLVLKYLLSQHTQLPTILFDEVDTGVSGKIAGKLARMLRSMSEQLQVISITHLPQVAGAADQHLRVEKEMDAGSTISHLQVLSEDQRLVELAGMLSGEEHSEAALKNAEALRKGAG